MLSFLRFLTYDARRSQRLSHDGIDVCGGRIHGRSYGFRVDGHVRRGGDGGSLRRNHPRQLRQQHLRVLFPNRFLVVVQELFDRLLGPIKAPELVLRVRHPIHGGVKILFLWILRHVLIEGYFRFRPLRVVNQVPRGGKRGIRLGIVAALLRGPGIRPGAVRQPLGAGLIKRSRRDYGYKCGDN